MTNPTKKTIDQMTASELQAELNEYLQAAQSGDAPLEPAVNPKDADPVGERLMRLPAGIFRRLTAKSLQSEISRVLKEGW